jgi:phosphoadenosine phosphosulfate reductase
MDLPALERAVEEARKAGIDGDARKVMLWARELLGAGLMMSTSFQKGGMVLLHMARELMPDLPVYFLDTGFHFQETLDFAETIKRDWGINLILKRGKLFGEEFKARHGNLYESNPNLCCHLNKVEPQNEILAEYQGWITAIRRDQASTRAQSEVLEVLEGPKLKVQPLAFWTREEVSSYLKEHQVPVHPLYSQGYSSIGCGPCTQPSSDPNNERAGRWGGKKVECGLHTFWKSRCGPPGAVGVPAVIPAPATPPASPGQPPAHHGPADTPITEGAIIPAPAASPKLPKAAAG